MTNPGGTGRPRLVISARFAPLPPRRSFMSRLPSLKSYTYLGTGALLARSGREWHSDLVTRIRSLSLPRGALSTARRSATAGEGRARLASSAIFRFVSREETLMPQAYAGPYTVTPELLADLAH